MSENMELLGDKNCKKCQGFGYRQSETPHESGRGKAWAALCECAKKKLEGGKVTENDELRAIRERYAQAPVLTEREQILADRLLTFIRANEVFMDDPEGTADGVLKSIIDNLPKPSPTSAEKA